MPDKSTVFRWLENDPKFRDQYARAREQQADHYAEEVVDIADEDPATVFSTEGRGENAADIERVDGAAVAHQRLRVDARKWYASKLAPKKYGDRTLAELTGKDGNPLMPQYDPLEVARRIGFVLTQAIAHQEPS